MKNSIEIYDAQDGSTTIEVKMDNDTVWLNRNQLSELFDRDVKTIGKHINNVFKEGELNENSVVANFATTAKDGKTYKVDYYNLDVIISVGYRVNSKRGTQFRQWATQRLKDYLVKGYAVNEQKLKASQEQLNSLKQSIKLLENVVAKKELSSDETKGLLKVVSEYAQALDLLDQYDHQRLQIPSAKKEKLQKLAYKEAIEQIHLWRAKQKAGKLFGNEKDQSFKSYLETIYQTNNGVYF